MFMPLKKRTIARFPLPYMGSSDELVTKLRGGSADYDVDFSFERCGDFDCCGSRLSRALDLSKFSSYSQLSPQLTSLPLVKVNGQFMVCRLWGPVPLYYDTTAFAQPPDTWNVFWDAKYRGKISVWDDLSTVYMAAQLLGYDKPDPRHFITLATSNLKP